MLYTRIILTRLNFTLSLLTVDERFVKTALLVFVHAFFYINVLCFFATLSAVQKL